MPDRADFSSGSITSSNCKHDFEEALFPKRNPWDMLVTTNLLYCPPQNDTD